jgi:hypothetical protein
MLRRAPLGALVALLLLAGHVHAQTGQRFSIQLSALGVELTGVTNEELRFGGGGELQFRWNPSAFSIGIGGQTTVHEVERVTVTYKGVFIEPRYVLTSFWDRVALYASARLMSLQATFELQGIEIEGDGSAIAGGGGFLISLGSRVNGELGVTFGKEFYDGEAADGTTVVSRLGIAIGIG